MQVSVVIPCYNASAFVPAAVESALSQRVAVREVIVVDDGSSDDPAAALASIDDPRVRVERTENHGVARARNLGASLASGDLVAFLDADDSWYPEKLERQLALLAEESATVAVGAPMHHVGARGTVGVTGELVLDEPSQQLIRAGRLMPFALSSSVIRLAAFREVGGFDESLHQAEDLDLVARLARLGPIRTVGEPMGRYRVHTDSASARAYREQRTATRFVRARLAARATGGDLTYDEFTASRRGAQPREWLDDTARSLYRSAGVHAADRHYFGAAWRLAASVVMHPSYALRRLRRQQVAGQLRGGGHDRTD